MPVMAKVKIKRGDDWPKVNPGAAAIDGRTFYVSPAGDADQECYPGEMAWMPSYDQAQREAGAPVWIAQGDLVFVNGT